MIVCVIRCSRKYGRASVVCGLKPDELRDMQRSADVSTNDVATDDDEMVMESDEQWRVERHQRELFLRLHRVPDEEDNAAQLVERQF